MMRSVLLIITLIASTSLLSQTEQVGLVINDLKYDEGIESEWDVLYTPPNPEAPIENLDKGDGWALNTRFGHRVFVLEATKPGGYLVTQKINGFSIQIVSINL
jgi:hypothetical protein